MPIKDAEEEENQVISSKTHAMHTCNIFHQNISYR